MSNKSIFEFPNPVDAPSPTGPFSEKHGPNALDEIPSSRLAIADIIANWFAADATIRIFLIGKFGEDLKAASALVDLARADNFVSKLLPVVVSLKERKDMAEAVNNFILVRENVKNLGIYLLMEYSLQGLTSQAKYLLQQEIHIEKIT